MEARAFLTQPGRSFGARIHAELAAKHEALSKAQLDTAHAVGLHHWQSARDANSFGRFCECLQTRVGVDNGGDARLVHCTFERSHILFDAVSEDERVGIVNDRIASQRCGARGIRIFRIMHDAYRSHDICCICRKFRGRNHARTRARRCSLPTVRRRGREHHPMHAIGAAIENVKHGFPAQPARCGMFREGFEQLALGRLARAPQ